MFWHSGAKSRFLSTSSMGEHVWKVLFKSKGMLKKLFNLYGFTPMEAQVK
jgi:hypothetical protein